MLCFCSWIIKTSNGSLDDLNKDNILLTTALSLLYELNLDTSITGSTGGRGCIYANTSGTWANDNWGEKGELVETFLIYSAGPLNYKSCLISCLTLHPLGRISLGLCLVGMWCMCISQTSIRYLNSTVRLEAYTSLMESKWLSQDNTT